jgi:hypothetical protein
VEMRTYTSLWNIEKRLYRFYDMNLPYPVSIKQIGALFGFGIPWLLLMNIIGLPFAPPFGHLIWLAPPVVFVWYSNRPVAEGKKLFDYVYSQARYFLGPRQYADLAVLPGSQEGGRTLVRARFWRRHGR